MSKNEILLDLSPPAATGDQPLSVIIDGFAEGCPRDSTDKAPAAPGLRRRFRLVVAGSDLLVQPVDDLFAAVNPLVPVLEDHRAAFSLILQ